MERRQARSSKIHVLALVGLILLSSIGRISSLSVTVNDEECVQEYVLYEGDTVSGNFVVVDHDIFWGSDHPGLDFTVTSPAGNIVQTLKGTSGDKFEFKAPRSGMYKFCFHNPYSTPETVSFYIHVGHIPNEHDLAKDEHLDPVNVKIAELREALESVVAEQKYLKARDTRHRHTNESTRKRVIFYTVGEYIFLAAASGLQVLYIRKLFSKLFALVDDMFCIFQGHIENIPFLKQQYGLTKSATEVIIVIEAYRTLRDRGPYSADQVVRDFQGKFAFMLFDCTTKNVFLAGDADGSVPFFWGADAEGNLVVSDDVETVKKGCGKSFAPFPKGCFFTSSGGLRSYEHPLNELKPVPRVDSSGQVCGVTFKVDSEAKKEGVMPRVGSVQNWSQQI